MPRFKPGQSGNPRGMRKGTKHRTTPEIRTLARRLFNREYWELKQQQLLNGSCHPKIESLLLSYGFGNPPREITNTGVVVHLGPLEALRQSPRVLDVARDDVTTIPPLVLLPVKDEEPH
jgi:hypothetical protein